MELFLILSILAGAGWAVTNIFDDAIIRNWESEDFIQITVWTSLSRLIILPLFLYFGILSVPKQSDVILSILTGLVSFIGIYAYYRALDLGEIVGLAVISESSPVIVLIGSVVFLGSNLTILQILGIVLIVIGAIIVSTRMSNLHQIEFTDETLWIGISTVCFSLVSLLSDISASSFSNDFAQIGWIWIGLVGTGIFYLCISVATESLDIDNTTEKLSRKIILYLVLGTVSETLAYIAFFQALEMGDVAIASAVSSVRPFFVLLMSLLIPSSDTGSLSFRRILVLVVAGTLMIIGGYLTQI
jgi:transporter family protein